MTAVTPAPTAWWRRHVIGLVACGGFVVLAAWGIGAWVARPHAPDHSGQTVAATFDYDCTNGIFWTDPRSPYRWWAGHDPVLPAGLDTAPPVEGLPPHRHSEGALHFDNATQATFTSDAGGQLVLVRQPLNQLYFADCSVN